MPMIKMNVLLALTMVSMPYTSAFTMSKAPITMNHSFAPVKFTPLSMSDDDNYDFPSDTSSESTIDIESEPYEPTPTESLENSILDMLPTEGGPFVSSAENRADINEAILKLEAMNPTSDPARSSLLNGIWTLKYAGGYDAKNALPSPTRQLALFLYSGGYSPGLFALNLASTLPTALVEVGDLQLAISRENPRVEAKIDVKVFGGASNAVVVKTNLEVQSSVRLLETYESATVLGRSIDIPEPLQYARDLYITYLDDDVLIVRDGSGVPELLVRKN